MGLGGHTNRDREPIAAFCPLSRPRALHRRTTRNWTTVRCTGAYFYVRPEQHDRRLLYASHGRAGWNSRQHYGLLRRPARPIHRSGGIPSYLLLALVEIIRGAPGGSTSAWISTSSSSTWNRPEPYSCSSHYQYSPHTGTKTGPACACPIGQNIMLLFLWLWIISNVNGAIPELFDLLCCHI